ncbi:hypothetical protein HanRHA438_Chr04g0171281 [Helianthus annuus]|nr:hypothetical protein HanIR_Chr04g0174141 [Helianthus annuus]KAJ0926447.1 hypothetical protein HanRHA438_Chr04g0171281 [Helianthus annuus]
MTVHSITIESNVYVNNPSFVCRPNYMCLYIFMYMFDRFRFLMLVYLILVTQ